MHESLLKSVAFLANYKLLIGIMLPLATVAAEENKFSNEHEKSSTIPNLTTKSEGPYRRSNEPKITMIQRINNHEAKTLDFDMRDRRELYDIGNVDTIYPQIAKKRINYEQDPRAYFYNPSQQSIHSSYPVGGYPQYPQYPQYLEAPEPIIEIIIKDSNETLPIPEAQPIATKKKKEKVHVYYVNYKKDQNNKLYLESPIASLNNDDTDEEIEDIVQLPAPVTNVPPLQYTTLRTIIHPDSEKYHSNSGIQVTFGTEDKNQNGHILSEYDAESIKRQVIAVPLNDPIANGLNQQQQQLQHQHFIAHSRYEKKNNLIGPHFKPHPSERDPKQTETIKATFEQKYTNLFEPVKTNDNDYQQKLHDLTKKYQNQVVGDKTLSTASLSNPHLQTEVFHTGAQPANQQSTSYYPQEYIGQQQLPLINNYMFNYDPNLEQTNSAYLSKVAYRPFFDSNIEPNRQIATQYQPIKFRPTPVPQYSHNNNNNNNKQIPTTLENSHYRLHKQKTQQNQRPINQYSHAHMQKYEQEQHQSQAGQLYQSQSQSQQQSPQPHQKQPIQYPQLPQQQHQKQQTPSQLTLQQQRAQESNKRYLQPTPQQQHPPSYQFNRQPQYVQQPSFTVPSPQLPIQTITAPNHFSFNSNNNNNNNNYYKSRAQPKQQQPASSLSTSTSIANTQTSNNNQYSAQKLFYNNNFQNTVTNTATNQQSGTNIRTIHNYLNVQPSKETELLKSIPQFEQHITETINTPFNYILQSQSQSPAQTQSQIQSLSQVIHDIPAPNLAPIQRIEQHQQQQTNTAGNLVKSTNFNVDTNQQQFVNYIATTPEFGKSRNGQKIMIVTPMPPSSYNQYQINQYNTTTTENVQQQKSHQRLIDPLPNAALATSSLNDYIQNSRKQTLATSSSSLASTNSGHYSVSTIHSDVFKELDKRQEQHKHQQQQQSYAVNGQHIKSSSTPSPATPKTIATHIVPSSAVSPTTINPKASQTLLQLPDEVPDDLRQKLLHSGILNNADISVLDYDKVGDIALENLPTEHLQHFYGNGGGAQISESNKILTIIKPNGEKLEKTMVPQTQNIDIKIEIPAVVSITDVNRSNDNRQYNRYLPLKINAAQFPISNNDELSDKILQCIVVLAPVEAHQEADSTENKEVRFLGGDLIKALVKKPTRENFKKWLEHESRNDEEIQAIVLLVAKSSIDLNQQKEIFMYDINTGSVNKLNGKLSSAFVDVAEENASTEDLDHASTSDQNFLKTMLMDRNAFPRTQQTSEPKILPQHKEQKQL